MKKKKHLGKNEEDREGAGKKERKNDRQKERKTEERKKEERLLLVLSFKVRLISF